MDTATIEKSYELTIDGIERITKGNISNNFKIKTTNERYYFLKEYHTNTTHLQQIHEAQKYFHRHKVPLVLPILNSNGSTITQYQGLYYALFPYVSGLVLSYDELSDIHLGSLAETLAKIHKLGAHCPTALKLTKTITNKKFRNRAHKLLEHIDSKETLSDFDKNLQSGINQKLKIHSNFHQRYITPEIVSDHIIHGDYYQDNVFFNREKKVALVFDWDGIKNGSHIAEILRCIDISCMNGPNEDENMKRVKTFIQTYHSIYPLSPTKIKEGVILNYLDSIENLWIETEYYLNNNSRLNDLHSIRMKRLKYMSNNLEEFSESIESFIC